MFKIPHLIFLLGTFVIVSIVSHRFKKKSHRFVDTFIKFSAILTLFFDPVYWIWEINTFGKVDFSTTLPLYVCSLFWMLIPIVAFAKEGIVKQTATASLCTVCIISGTLGLVFNVHLNNYPFFSFVPLRSLLYHVIMVLVPSVMWASGYYKVQKGDWFRSMIPICMLLVPCLILNKLFGWDYCYTAGGIGTPLEYVSKLMPKPAFLIFLYGLLYLIIRLTFYRKFKLFSFKKGDEMASSFQ